MFDKKVMEFVLGYEIDYIYDRGKYYRVTPKSRDYLIPKYEWSRGDKVTLTYNKYNKYELADMCVQWCLGKGYELTAKQPIVPNDEGFTVINFWFIAYIFKLKLGVYGDDSVRVQVLERNAVSIKTDNYADAIFRGTEWVYKAVYGE